MIFTANRSCLLPILKGNGRTSSSCFKNSAGDVVARQFSVLFSLTARATTSTSASVSASTSVNGRWLARHRHQNNAPPPFLAITPFMRQTGVSSNANAMHPLNDWNGRRFSSSQRIENDGADHRHTYDRPLRLSQVVSKLCKDADMSRRQAEMKIRGGNVKVNGKVITSPQYDFNAMARFGGSSASSLLSLSDDGHNVSSESGIRNVDDTENNDNETTAITITMDENVIAFADSVQDLASQYTDAEGKMEQAASLPKVWAAHKLKGELITHHDPFGRPTLLDRVQRGGITKEVRGGKNVTLKPIGRLDMTTEGLILLTTCGHYAREMELPSSQLHRTYRVRVHGRLTAMKLDRLRNGGTFRWEVPNESKESGYETMSHYYGPMKVQMEAIPRGRDGNFKARSNNWLQITCREGKNRQIRNALSALGLTVTRLIRISFGDYQLHSIPPGMVLRVPYKPVAKQVHKGKKNFQTKPKSNELEEYDAARDDEGGVQWVQG